jgi:hypothetical protein
MDADLHFKIAVISLRVSSVVTTALAVFAL